MSDGSRHLSLASFDQYLRSGVAIDHPIDGDPRLILRIDPAGPAVGLRAPRRANEVSPRIGLEHVRVVAGRGEDGRYLEVRVIDPRLFTDAYPVLCAMADRMQIQGLGFTAAVSETLRLLGHLLQHRPSLPRERELGLCGELLLFIGFCRLLGGETALASWRGPNAAEHDFGLAGLDIEVKTTSTERRAHWVQSLTQLQATASRPLWLVSHQLTEAGPDGGWRLGDLVSAARDAVTATGLRHELDRWLIAAGWADPLADLCRTRWRRRFPSAAYLVDGDFPRLTAALLSEAGIGSARLTAVQYQVDLTDQPAGARIPKVLADVITTEVTT